MNHGYTLLWRKICANPLLSEPGRKFSRLEAWLYLTKVLAAGMDDETSGVKRGEFRASSRYLARKWSWPRSTVQRFFKELESAGMISRIEDGNLDANSVNFGLGHSSGHLAGHLESSKTGVIKAGNARHSLRPGLIELLENAVGTHDSVLDVGACLAIKTESFLKIEGYESRID